MNVTNRNKHRATLQAIPFFSCFSNEDLSTIEQIIMEKSVRKNDVILWEEETKDYMYIVFSGKIKVVQMGPEGKEQILVIRKKGDFFGEMALLDGKTQPATVVAMEDATVGLVSKNDFETHFLNNDKVLKEFISMLCERLRESWLMLRVLSFDNAEDRVRAVLNNVSSLYGVKDMRGTIIPLKLTHQEIANYA